MALTEKQKKAYLKNPGHCPWCKSMNITASSIDVEGDGAVQEVRCSECGKAWYDYYKLTNVEEIIQ